MPKITAPCPDLNSRPHQLLSPLPTAPLMTAEPLGSASHGGTGSHGRKPHPFAPSGPLTSCPLQRLPRPCGSTAPLWATALPLPLHLPPALSAVKTLLPGTTDHQPSPEARGLSRLWEERLTLFLPNDDEGGNQSLAKTRG